METNWAHLLHLIFQCLIFSAIGLGMFGISFVMFEKLIKVSVKKEIVEDQNVGLGIIMGAFVLGIALIISAAIRG